MPEIPEADQEIDYVLNTRKGMLLNLADRGPVRVVTGRQVLEMDLTRNLSGQPEDGARLRIRNLTLEAAASSVHERANERMPLNPALGVPGLNPAQLNEREYRHMQTGYNGTLLNLDGDPQAAFRIFYTGNGEVDVQNTGSLPITVIEPPETSPQTA